MLFNNLKNEFESYKQSKETSDNIEYKDLKKEFDFYKQKSKEEIVSLKEMYNKLEILYTELNIKYIECIENSNTYFEKLKELENTNHNLEKNETQNKLLQLETSCKYYKEFYDKYTQNLDTKITKNSHIQTEVVNIVKNFIPLTSEFIYQQMKDICPIQLSQIGVNYIGIHAVNSKIGDNIVVTDTSRKVCSYINGIYQIVKDPNCNNLIRLIIKETSKTENLKQAIEISENISISSNKAFDIYNNIKKITTNQDNLDTIVSNVTNQFMKTAIDKQNIHTLKRNMLKTKNT